ncbi:uncharacterized protein LOC143427117 [Xylocopa sonorina]|uniref:uncharacterized protein LOC143427117 n=1 Tax=Xylocopa sonorina TaxID=1818115 RepID=UPI00403B27B9
MDHLSSPPSKKTRKMKDINIPIIECKREFTLPHKFPSMINCKKYNVTSVSLVKNQEMVTAANSKLSGNLISWKNKMQVPMHSIKKLRIKTQDGKDLGEVKVQFLTRKNTINTQKSVHTRQTLDSTNNINELFKSLSLPGAQRSQAQPVGSQIVIKSISPNKLPATVQKLPEVQDKNKDIVKNNYVLTKINKANQNNGLLLLKKLRDISNVSATATPRKKDNLTLPSEEKKNSNSEKKDVSNKNSCIPTEVETQKKTNLLSIKSLDTQLAKLKFPIVRCEKLSISKNEVIVNRASTSPAKKNTKKRSNSDLTSYPLKETDESNKNVHNMKSKESKRYCVDISEKDTGNSKKEKFDNKTGNNDAVIAISEQEKNCTSIPVNNRNIDNKNQNECTEANNKVDSCETDINITLANKIVDSDKEKKLSECLDVIKQALISVQDEELRAKALHALAECGIGKGKQVPIIPPEKLRTVHDSQIQTEVFGLLEATCFILVKEDTPALSRIKQTERSTIKPPPIMREIQTQTETQDQPKPINYCIDNIDLYQMKTPVPVEDSELIFDFDNYLNDYFNHNADVNRVKQIFSMPHDLYKKGAIQLERDYEGMKEWDDNGMLNIHKAVLNDRVQEVQRLLLVLKASKIDIDVLTEDGMTCLELAVKYDASENIVKLLLEAGAKPILSELLHESAVILASKQSSSLLPRLLSYVTEPKLLNQVDSTGFAPLHYCASNGYLEGVNALIQAGAEVNLKDNRSGRTPFFHALEHSHALIAQKLLDSGAIADLPNFSGQSVLSLVDDTKSLSLKAALKHIII